MDQVTLKFLESQLQASKDFITYVKHSNYVIHPEFSPRDYLKIAKGLERIVLDDKDADKKWRHDTLYAIQGLFSHFPYFSKRMRYENDKLLRESIKLKESQVEKSSNRGEIKNGKGKKG